MISPTELISGRADSRACAATPKNAGKRWRRFKNEAVLALTGRDLHPRS